MDSLTLTPTAASQIMAAPAAAAGLAGFLDLSLLEDLTEAEIQLKRNGKELPVFVTLAGPEHPLRKALAYAAQKKSREAFMASGMKLTASDPAQEDADLTETLIRCVLGWRGVAFEGAPLQFSPEAVRRVLTDPKRAWFRAAVSEAFNDREAFIKTSAIN